MVEICSEEKVQNVKRLQRDTQLTTAHLGSKLRQCTIEFSHLLNPFPKEALSIELLDNMAAAVMLKLISTIFIIWQIIKIIYPKRYACIKVCIFE